MNKLLKDNGQSLAEYALILALVAVVAIGGLGTLGGKISQNFGNATTALNTASDGGDGTHHGGPDDPFQ